MTKAIITLLLIALAACTGSYAGGSTIDTSSSAVVAKIETAYAPRSSPAPLIWFSTEDPYIRAAGGYPSNDYRSLFTDPASQWQTVLSNLNGFVIGANIAGYARSAPDRAQILPFLKGHSVSTVVNAGMVEPDPVRGCGGGEGYAYNLGTPYPVTTSNRYIYVAANNFRSLGYSIDYLSMDEPLYRGHILYNLGRPAGQPTAPIRIGCQYSISELAQKIQPSIQIIRSIFPNVKIGQTINLNNAAVTKLSDAVYEGEMEEWALAYKLATGEPMAFSLVVIGPNDQAQWAVELPKLAAFYRAQGTFFGIVYTASGNPSLVPDNATWIRNVVDEYTTVENGLGIHPDFVTFASWVKYPLENLPETMSGTFANVILEYLRWHHNLGCL